MAEFEFFGETFAFNPGEDYEWQMMEFASAANGGADGNLLSGAAAAFDLLRAAVVEKDWGRFRECARKNRAQVERDLMPLVVQAFTQRTERPTGRPSDSSDGPKNTKRKSASEQGSAGKVIKRLEKQGRPDLALIATYAAESRSELSA